MSTPYDEVSPQDNGPFKEYSVIYTDRALNLMSPPFCNVMKDLSSCLKETYNAEKVAIIPGCVQHFFLLAWRYLDDVNESLTL